MTEHYALAWCLTAWGNVLLLFNSWCHCDIPISIVRLRTNFARAAITKPAHQQTQKSIQHEPNRNSFVNYLLLCPFGLSVRHYSSFDQYDSLHHRGITYPTPGPKDHYLSPLSKFWHDWHICDAGTNLVLGDNNERWIQFYQVLRKLSKMQQ